MNDEDSNTIAVIDMSNPIPIGDLGHWRELAVRLSDRLQHPVEVLRNDSTGDEAYTQFVQRCDENRIHRMVILPVGKTFDFRALESSMVLLQNRNSSMQIYISDTVSLSEWARAIEQVADYEKSSAPSHVRWIISDGEVAEFGHEIVLVSHELNQLNHGRGHYEHAFVRGTFPTIGERVSRQTQQVRQLKVLPWRSHDSKHLLECVSSVAGDSVSVEDVTGDLFGPPAFDQLLLGKYLDALSWRSVERYYESMGNERMFFHSELFEIDKRMDVLLPPQYRARVENVRTQSMGSASIQFDGDGRVAWDKIWTSFCDLAMAGGPPHRGILLEAVSGEEVKRDIEQYKSVCAEIRRGIEMVSGLKTFESDSLGWVGIECDDEEMAVWLLRAIIVENIMVRRQGKSLFLPAGPNFTIKREIKNVITSVAKTVHYWRAHLRMNARQS